MEGIGKSNMISLQAKKGTGLNDLFKDYQPQQLEEHLALQNQPSVVRELFFKYEKILKTDDLSIESYQSLTQVLLPEELQTLAAIMYLHIADDTSKALYPISQEVTSLFLSKLLQNSYDHGNNDFHLAVPDAGDSKKRWHHEWYDIVVYWDRWNQFRLHGSRQRPLNITVHGDAGYNALCGVLDADITIHGEVSNFASKAQRSTFNVKKAYNTIGAQAVDCYFKIGEWFPRFFIRGDPAYNCTFEIERVNTEYVHFPFEDYGGINAQKSTFKFHREEDVKKIGDSIFDGNCIKLIRPDGTEETVREE